MIPQQSHLQTANSNDYNRYQDQINESFVSPSSHPNGRNLRSSSSIKNNNRIVQEILCEQDLSRAGNLFTLSNDVLLNEFPITIEILKSIIDNKNYVNNLNQQSIVEIVLTKCISALRESKMITNYYDDLLDLLEICLKYNLNNGNRNSFRTSQLSDYNECGSQTISTNTPHANIVSDILSCILLDYLDDELSVKAIPVCIKLLQHHNCKRELLREISSYLNLVACRSPELLNDYVYYIVNAMLKGSLPGLAHLLYQICESSIEGIYPLIKHLIKGLRMLESSNDLLNVLQIMYLVSLNHVQLVIVHLEDLIVFLADEFCQDTILDILYSIANQSPIALESYLVLFENSSSFYDDSHKVDKIIGTVGKSLRKKSEYCTNLLIQRVKKSMNKSIKSNGLQKRLSNCVNADKSRLSQILKDNSFTLHDYNNNNNNNNNSTMAESPELNVSDKNKNKSSSKKKSTEHGDVDSNEDEFSLNKSIQIYDDQKRFIQILGEIFEIAQVFPGILNTFFKPICDLFPHPSDNISMIIDRFKQLKSENSSMCSKEDLFDEDQDEDEFLKSIRQTNLNSSRSKLSILDHSEDSIETKIKQISKDILLENEKSNKFEFDENQNSNDEKIIIANKETITEDSDTSNNSIFINLNTSKLETVDEVEIESNSENQINDSFIELKCRSEINLEITENVLSDTSISRDLKLKSSKYEYSELSTSKRILEEISNASLIITKINEESETEEEPQSKKLEDESITEFLNPNEFKTDLEKQISESDHPISSTMRLPNENNCSFQVDFVQRFLMKHMDKIKGYIENINKSLPIPVSLDIISECNNETLKRNSLRRGSLNRSHSINDYFLKKFKSKRNVNLKFMCSQKNENHCLFSENHFESTSLYPTTWIHILFLSFQARSAYALKQQDKCYLDLKAIYEKLNEKTPFIALITSSFPSDKQISELKEELNESRLFDLFEYPKNFVSDDKNESQELDESLYTSQNSNRWICYLCANPDKFSELHDEKPLIQGQLKEKHGKWKFLRRWHKRVFTLAAGSIVYFKKDMRQESLNVRYINEIQTIRPSSSKSNSGIPKAFEIFTDRNSFILKAQNSTDADKWIQYIKISKALENSRFNSKFKSS